MEGRDGLYGGIFASSGLLTVGAPVPLVRAGVGVEDDDAPVPVAVGDIHFVGRRIGEDLRRLPEVLHVIAAVVDAVLPQLQQESSHRS